MKKLFTLFAIIVASFAAKAQYTDVYVNYNGITSYTPAAQFYGGNATCIQNNSSHPWTLPASPTWLNMNATASPSIWISPTTPPTSEINFVVFIQGSIPFPGPYLGTYHLDLCTLPPPASGSIFGNYFMSGAPIRIDYVKSGTSVYLTVL